MSRRHPLLTAYLAFASVCFFWGTTYLGIRIALESLPPLFLVSVRFLLSGGLLLLGVRLAGIALPRGRELWMTGLFGILVLGMGNGCLTFSELLITSSLAALFVAVSPLWMVGIEAMFPGGERLTRGILAGMIVGMMGAGLLVGPDVFKQGFSGVVVQGFLLLQFGSACWGLGSILQRRRQAGIHPVASAAVQQFAAGLFFLPAMLLERQPVQWDVKGVGALLYLALFGSIVGYTAYLIALSRLPVAIVSLYTYVNPVVAAILGWLIYRERFGPRETSAMAVIFLSVAIVKKYGHRG
ncbi:MAG: EamA family transporter [Acidobacteria bacterium]|nr:EamA family transporter [Acidobacteriota bacterium]